MSTFSEKSSADADTTDGGAVNQKRYKVVFVAPTCFYYQVPIFQELAANPRIDLTVYFCSKESLDGKDVLKLFNSSKGWGLGDELLQGYNYKFLANYSPTNSYLSWPTGLFNPGVFKGLSTLRPDAVVIMAWNNPTWWLTILACLILKIPLFYMNDANIQAELSSKRWKSLMKKVILGKMFFPITAGFLSSGKANDRLYQLYGVPVEKLVPFAYSLVHNAFLPEATKLRARKNQLRAELGIPNSSFVILFTGRLIREKGVLDLVEAFRRIRSPDIALVFVGEGEFGKELRKYVTQEQIDPVLFFGYQNRLDVTKFYAISDVLVLPSHRETWGMVINEALCFGLPVIVSDQVGAREDLVSHGYNGFHFPVRNVESLTARITELMELSEDERAVMGVRSLRIIEEWSQKKLAESLLEYLDLIHPTGFKRKNQVSASR